MRMPDICRALVIASVTGSGAFAQTATNPELRLLEFTNADSTSTCIGNPVTPLCAAETFAACRLRAEWTLCTDVGYEPGDWRRYVPTIDSKLSYHPYEVIDTRRVQAEFAPRSKEWLPTIKWQPGDVAVRLLWQGCSPNKKCFIETRDDPNRRHGEGCRTFEFCRKDSTPNTYIVRKAGHRWNVLIFYIESYHPVIQGEFRNRK